MPGRIAFRCDGGANIGAGHVARCLPLARAFAGLGWEPVFVGDHTGLSRWLLDRAGAVSVAPDAGPCGLVAREWTAAVVDSYSVAEDELCALGKTIPVATLGEARRCPAAGVLLDYHLDAPGPDTRDLPMVRLVAGPRFAPLDDGLLAARRPRPDVRRALVTVGGTNAARQLIDLVLPPLRRAFPGVTLLVAASGEEEEAGDVERLPEGTALADVLVDVDVAVSAAGLTAYELACAGVPAVVVAIANNQRRVARACTAAGVALGIDGAAGDPFPMLTGALQRLADPVVRDGLAATGTAIFDGHGAARAAAAIAERWVA